MALPVFPALRSKVHSSSLALLGRPSPQPGLKKLKESLFKEQIYQFQKASPRPQTLTLTLNITLLPPKPHIPCRMNLAPSPPRSKVHLSPDPLLERPPPQPGLKKLKESLFKEQKYQFQKASSLNLIFLGSWAGPRPRGGPLGA